MGTKIEFLKILRMEEKGYKFGYVVDTNDNTKMFYISKTEMVMDQKHQGRTLKLNMKEREELFRRLECGQIGVKMEIEYDIK